MKGSESNRNSSEFNLFARFTYISYLKKVAPLKCKKSNFEKLLWNKLFHGLFWSTLDKKRLGDNLKRYFFLKEDQTIISSVFLSYVRINNKVK